MCRRATQGLKIKQYKTLKKQVSKNGQCSLDCFSRFTNLSYIKDIVVTIITSLIELLWHLAFGTRNACVSYVELLIIFLKAHSSQLKKKKEKVEKKEEEKEIS